MVQPPAALSPHPPTTPEQMPHVSEDLAIEREEGEEVFVPRQCLHDFAEVEVGPVLPGLGTRTSHAEYQSHQSLARKTRQSFDRSAMHLVLSLFLRDTSHLRPARSASERPRGLPGAPPADPAPKGEAGGPLGWELPAASASAGLVVPAVSSSSFALSTLSPSPASAQPSG
eukprot:RCo007671